MNSFKVAICLFAIASQTFAGHPYPRTHDEDSDVYSNYHQNSRKRDNKPTEQLSSSYSRNKIPRLSSEFIERAPQASNILEMTREGMLRFPREMGMRALSEVCYGAISTEALNPTYNPEQTDMKTYLMSENRQIVFPMEQIENVWNHHEYDTEKDLIVFINSWKYNSEDENDPTNVLRKAYSCRGTDNFILIDVGHFVENYHALQTLNTELVGQWIGDALRQLKEHIPVSKMHLIGHGVGAHVAGAAGRRFTEMTGESLPRITGLDPAMLCYKKQNVVELRRGDAMFVDIIHSNSYGLGYPAPTGDVDFYPNGRKMNAPGSNNVMTDHEMAVRYYAETVMPDYERNFMATKNYNHYEMMKNNEEVYVPMGYSTPRNMKGVFYLETNSKAPYGKNSYNNSPRCMRQPANY